MTIGLEQFRDEHQVDRLPGMLLLPLLGKTGDYPVGGDPDRPLGAGIRPSVPASGLAPRPQSAEESVAR